MSDPNVIERDAKTGRFLTGHKAAGPGRPKGARSKLGEQFVSDLRDAWEEHGPDVIARVARDEPAQFLRVIASLMPKDINLNVGVDPVSFGERFRNAFEMLGNAPPTRMPKLPKVIDHG